MHSFETSNNLVQITTFCIPNNTFPGKRVWTYSRCCFCLDWLSKAGCSGPGHWSFPAELLQYLGLICNLLMSTQYVFRTLPFISCFLQEFWVPWMWKLCKFIALTEKKCKALSRTSRVYHFSLWLYHLFSWALFSLWSKENLELVWFFFLKSRDLLALQTQLFQYLPSFALSVNLPDTQQ